MKSEFGDFALVETDLFAKVALNEKTWEAGRLLEMEGEMHPDALDRLLENWRGRARALVILMSSRSYLEMRKHGRDVLYGQEASRVGHGLVASFPTEASRLKQVAIVVHRDIPSHEVWVVGRDEGAWVKQGIRTGQKTREEAR